MERDTDMSPRAESGKGIKTGHAGVTGRPEAGATWVNRATDGMQRTQILKEKQ